MQDSRTVQALLTLLGDDDRQIVNTAEKKLLEIGPGVFPLLKARFDEQPLNVKLRIRGIMEELKPRDLVDEFRRIPPETSEEPLDLEEALFTIARIGYPSLKQNIYQRKLDLLADEINAELERWQVLDAHTVVETVINVIFKENGFQGNVKNYYDPQNSFINRVLQRKTGNPVLLTAIVLLVAKRLTLPFTAIGMPAHCILGYPLRSDRLFVDPFYGGKILTREDCIEFLTTAGFGFVDEYLEPIDNKNMVMRILRNLVNIYHRKHNNSRVQELRTYLAIVGRRY